MNIDSVLFMLPQSLQDVGRQGRVGRHIILRLDLFKEKFLTGFFECIQVSNPALFVLHNVPSVLKGEMDSPMPSGDASDLMVFFQAGTINLKGP